MMYSTLYPSSFTSPAQTTGAVSSILGPASADTTSLIPGAAPAASGSEAQFAAPQLTNIIQALYMMLQFLSSMIGQMDPSAGGGLGLPGAQVTDPGSGGISPYSTSPSGSDPTGGAGGAGGAGGSNDAGGTTPYSASPSGSDPVGGSGGSDGSSGGDSNYDAGGSNSSGGAHGSGHTHGSGGAHGSGHAHGSDGAQGSGGAADPGGTQGAVGKNGAGKAGSVPSKSGHQELDKWDAAIQKAATATGLPANYIKATIWAESRGDQSESSKNMDGNTDVGLMQISNSTYKDVYDRQSKEGANIPKPGTLNLQGSGEDNIMAGAWELKDKLEHQGGGDYGKTSEAYVGTGKKDFDATYGKNVLKFWEYLDAGKTLPDEDPYKYP